MTLVYGWKLVIFTLRYASRRTWEMSAQHLNSDKTMTTRHKFGSSSKLGKDYEFKAIEYHRYYLLYGAEVKRRNFGFDYLIWRFKKQMPPRKQNSGTRQFNINVKKMSWLSDVHLHRERNLKNIELRHLHQVKTRDKWNPTIYNQL
jgi:hypothetical protein